MRWITALDGEVLILPSEDSILHAQHQVTTSRPVQSTPPKPSSFYVWCISQLPLLTPIIPLPKLMSAAVFVLPGADFPPCSDVNKATALVYCRLAGAGWPPRRRALLRSPSGLCSHRLARRRPMPGRRKGFLDAAQTTSSWEEHVALRL